MVERKAEEDVEKAGWGRKCEVWFEKGRYTLLITVVCRHYSVCCWVEVNLATLTCWWYSQLLGIGVTQYEPVECLLGLLQCWTCVFLWIVVIDIHWVAGECVTVDVSLFNPLSVELRVDKMVSFFVRFSLVGRIKQRSLLVVMMIQYLWLAVLKIWCDKSKWFTIGYKNIQCNNSTLFVIGYNKGSAWWWYTLDDWSNGDERGKKSSSVYNRV